MDKVNIYVKSFYFSPKNVHRGKMNNFKLKILNNYGKSGNSNNDWNVPTVSVIFLWHTKQ